jgi:hypothetical protein
VVTGASALVLSFPAAIDSLRRPGSLRPRLPGPRLTAAPRLHTSPSRCCTHHLDATSRRRYIVHRDMMAAAADDGWERAEGVPDPTDPFIQKYLAGRDALVQQEKKQRSGPSPSAPPVWVVKRTSDTLQTTTSARTCRPRPRKPAPSSPRSALRSSRPSGPRTMKTASPAPTSMSFPA